MIKDYNVLDLTRKEKKVLSNRQTQSRDFYRYAQGVNNKDSPYYMAGPSFIASNTDLREINKDGSNETGIEGTDFKSSYSIGRASKTTYEAYDDLSLDPDVDNLSSFGTLKENFTVDRFTKEEIKSGVFDITRRNPQITRDVETQTNYEFVYAHVMGYGNKRGQGSSIQVMSVKLEDAKDIFEDKRSTIVLSNTDSFKIDMSNSYNSGVSSPFTETDLIYNNSLYNGKLSDDEHYESGKVFHGTGYFYSSNKTDSIAFGGLEK